VAFVNPQKALAAQLLAALGIATIGAGKFPPPHRYTGIFLLFFVLGVIANFGAQVARVAAALGGLVVVTIAMGQAGIRMFSFFGGVGTRLGIEPAVSSSAVGSTSLGGGLTAPRNRNPRAGGHPGERPT
jgi:hypothetical protein